MGLRLSGFWGKDPSVDSGETGIFDARSLGGRGGNRVRKQRVDIFGIEDLQPEICWKLRCGTVRVRFRERRWNRNGQRQATKCAM